MLRSRERFSLLLLEPGEIYFEDFSVICYPLGKDGKPVESQQQRGRLKVCSKSLVFEPANLTQPILKFPYKESKDISEWTGNLSLTVRTSSMGSLHLECSQVIEMLTGNVIAPYTFQKEKIKFIFLLNYVTPENCLPLILQLRRASTLRAAEQSTMIAAIVYSIQNRVTFDTSWLEDLYEKIILETQGNKISPLVMNPGRILLTSSRFYFQPYNNVEPYPVLKIKLSHIKKIIKQRFLLQEVGLEIYCEESAAIPHLFLALKSQDERDALHDNLMAQPDVQLMGNDQERITLQWQNGVISNYEYLLHLNRMAGRSFNDLTQYPVFPWILADYTSSKIDLSDPMVYRDLRKPIGALNESRLKRLKDRYKEMTGQKFLYGSHYSTPGFVLYYLVRKYPQLMLCLQNGRFDHPDRMFNSVVATWKNVTHNHSDFKELIPEFYDPDCMGDFLVNILGCDFGMKHNGEKVTDVELPTWASSPKDFVKTLREALESEYVSRNLHHWIDLIFGYKQKGEEAEKADNLFYYLSYEGSIDLDAVKDPNQRHALEVQIMEFGQIPKQLFKSPHPQRSSQLAANQFPVESPSQKAKLIRDRASSFHVVWKSIHKLHRLVEFSTHKEAVTAVAISADKKHVFSVGQDGLLKMFLMEEKKQLRSANLSDLALSSCIIFPDAKHVLVGSWDNNIIVYNIEFGKAMESLPGHIDAISSLAWNSNRLVSGSWDTTAKVWHCSDEGQMHFRLNSHLLAELEHESRVMCVALSKDNHKLLTGTDEGEVSLWDMKTCTLESKMKGHSGIISAVSFSPDGNRIVTCGEDGFLHVSDIDTGTTVYTTNTGESLKCLAWDGLTALLGTSEGNILVWDLVAVSLINKINAHTGAVTAVAVSGDGSLVVSGGDDRKVVVWTVES